MRKNKKNISKYIFIIVIIIIISLFFRLQLYNFMNTISNSISNVNVNMVNSKKNILIKIEEYKYKINAIVNFDANKKEILELKSKVELLEAQKLEIQNILEENERLRKILEIPKTKNLEYIIADVLFVENFQSDGVIYINKGVKDGLKENYLVVNNKKIVGKINKVKEDYSEVLLIYNSDFKLSVEINSSTLGILRGKGNYKFSINNFNLENAENIRNFSIKTSGISEYYPKDLLIGEYYLTDNSKFLKNKELELKIDFNVNDLDTLLIYKYDNKNLKLIEEIKNEKGDN